VNVAFFGTSEFGADALEGLTGCSDIEIAVVVTQPDRPSGRGRSLKAPPVADRARALGLEVVQTDAASLSVPDADAGVVVAFGQLVREPLLGAYPLFNLHPSLLPRWRGAAPIERAILAGDQETGVCVIELSEELDAGPIHACARFPVGPADDAGTLRETALELGVPLLAAALRGETVGVPQTGETTYASKLTADDRRVDWSSSAIEIDRRVRALAPDVGARADLAGRPVSIWRGRALSTSGGEPGAVQAPLVVSCGEGSYEVLELQPSGKRRMPAADYVRGVRPPA
jgi:methionyl-tRNA formyltransferase